VFFCFVLVFVLFCPGLGSARYDLRLESFSGFDEMPGGVCGGAGSTQR
jgi:hypothetical protein